MTLESQKNLFKRLGKVAMSNKLLVIEVMNEKQTYFNINFEYTRYWQKLGIQNYMEVWGDLGGGCKLTELF